MYKILYVSSKENIEVSCPDYLSPFLKLIWRHLKVKTVKLKSGGHIKTVYLDELSEYKWKKKDS